MRRPPSRSTSGAIVGNAAPRSPDPDTDCARIARGTAIPGSRKSDWRPGCARRAATIAPPAASSVAGLAWTRPRRNCLPGRPGSPRPEFASAAGAKLPCPDRPGAPPVSTGSARTALRGSTAGRPGCVPRASARAAARRPPFRIANTAPAAANTPGPPPFATGAGGHPGDRRRACASVAVEILRNAGPSTAGPAATGSGPTAIAACPICPTGTP